MRDAPQPEPGGHPTLAAALLMIGVVVLIVALAALSL